MQKDYVIYMSYRWGGKQKKRRNSYYITHLTLDEARKHTERNENNLNFSCYVWQYSGDHNTLNKENTHGLQRT